MTPPPLPPPLGRVPGDLALILTASATSDIG